MSETSLDVQQILGGIIPLALNTGVIGICVHYFIKNFKHFYSRKGPLIFCYVFSILSCIAITVDASVIVSRKLFVYASMSSACATFTAYSVIVYTWMDIVLAITFRSALARSWVKAGFWALMFFNWALTMILEYLYEAGNYVIIVSGPIVIFAYLTGNEIVKRSFTSQQSQMVRKITGLTNVACVVFTNCTLLITAVIVILHSVSTEEITIQVLHLPLDVGGYTAILMLMFHLEKFVQNHDPKDDQAYEAQMSSAYTRTRSRGLTISDRSGTFSAGQPRASMRIDSPDPVANVGVFNDSPATVAKSLTHPSDSPTGFVARPEKQTGKRASQDMDMAPMKTEESILEKVLAQGRRVSEHLNMSGSYIPLEGCAGAQSVHAPASPSPKLNARIDKVISADRRSSLGMTIDEPHKGSTYSL